MVGTDNADRKRVRLGTRFARASAQLRSDLTFAAMDAVTVLVTYTAALGLRAMDAPSAVLDYRFGFMVLLPLIMLTHLAANIIMAGRISFFSFPLLPIKLSSTKKTVSRQP